MTGLKRPLRPPDWSDTHAAPLRAELTTARAAYEVALGQLPPWTRRAMTIRNAIVGRLGLRTPDMQQGMADLPIVAESDESYELGLIDRHLTFTLQTIVEDDIARLTTRIWFNHWTGRLYLALVLIPHKIIVKLALRRLA
ncbi:DUF2867 domain-containing protein [Jannaschia sp. CCS1]|uniref:DUF2867 domain-containing protein n=1 Tax=Jannaschia sp. (strain CCS1) TaxID=290400 RepID=UPI000053BD65|nr:DUF2867 domain-containing protein [Jannaschia sp. CCS1]ABD54516.1 hypothetical protein Jann_1599 [Jannaschia sp. CCS1]